MRTLGLLNALAISVVLLAQYYDWGGAWLLVPLCATSSVSVFLSLRAREDRQLDQPTTLGLKG